ncbi:ComEC/Rec2 family competence protein [Deinococcus sp. UR1]|uniref:ComEC/Rec2 family competence protein n=1 Tax=Deinococcus sp. UR1 TaxID=1704277 RepID=UPI0011AF2CB9|nr:ComEC/Rec2 family competence protein [Deinococcus sp. UR1]
MSPKKPDPTPRKPAATGKAATGKASPARKTPAAGRSAATGQATGRATPGSAKTAGEAGASRTGASRAATGRATPGRTPTGRRGRTKTRSGPGASDLLGLLILVVTGSLAACGWIRQQDAAPAGSGPGTGAAPGPAGGTVTIRFLDVGQGDAILIRSPEGKTALIDGGRSAERLSDQLEKYGVTRLDLMIASHADADHIAGLVPAAALNPRVFINNGLGGTTQTWERLVRALQGVDATFTKASNQTVNLGSVKLRVIAPPPGMPDDQNLNSVGLAVQFGEFRALLTGDSETEETEGWLAQERADLRGPFQVYKSIHHGASNGDNAAWLANVRPENVVISVGQNSYGHPTAPTLRLYRQTGARVYRTDRHGTVTFEGRADGTYTADTER